MSRREGGRCQYPRLMMDVTGATLGFKYGERVQEQVKVEPGKVGFMKGSEGLIDEWKRLKMWMGRKVVMGRMEMSEVCRMSYMIEDDWDRNE